MAKVTVEAFPADVDLLQREGHFKARVTRTDEPRTPVANLDIDFRTGKSEIEIGDRPVATDADGIAEMRHGSLQDVGAIVDELTSGYNAVFEGNAQFEPAEGHGAVTILG
jgi:hypothetical protein